MATLYLEKDITISNISYLIQYGQVKKHEINGATLVDKKDILRYYKSSLDKREINWKKQLGEDLNWELAFDRDCLVF